MKTFDIALKYLNDFNLKSLNLYEEDESKNEYLSKEVEGRKFRFDKDPNNNKSNDYYRSMVFACALYHCAFKQQGLVSFFDVACQIVNENKSIFNIFKERYKRTAYPKLMVEKWNEYRVSLNPCPIILNNESEVELEFFMTAYHYVIDKDC